jgi:hypothetical protein
MVTTLNVSIEGPELGPEDLDLLAGMILQVTEDRFPFHHFEVSYSTDPRQDEIDKFNQIMTDIEQEREWDPASIQLP